ncbi:pseudouridylate synthase [Chitinophaga rhizophila]|uniref:Pseudouridylate synthase n=1 Tax=Chitinophaga rhizophila TaxID=2866212 RepID=A0ABS7G5S3_9BACT|nr:pseudouridylate synthase [Chitinophaga rhizophila]MBW8683006.1 pseudouridylate synthase [Chitinophaga rhizophila]
MSRPVSISSVFSHFDASADAENLSRGLVFSPDNGTHPLCLLAVAELQTYLQGQPEWNHNFGLSGDIEKVIGKMFGVLVVRTKDDHTGYLWAFSGKIGGGNHYPSFVPPVFDGLQDGSFLNAGMRELTAINQEINDLESLAVHPDKYRIQQLKLYRKQHSLALQQQLFSHYHFLNSAGVSKSLLELFNAAGYRQPPAGAGECAAPKLLQYAYLHGMQPLAMTEFWWGLSPKSATWKHGRFYQPCREKCAPILAHMLS